MQELGLDSVEGLKANGLLNLNPQSPKTPKPCEKPGNTDDPILPFRSRVLIQAAYGSVGGTKNTLNHKP